MKPLSKLSNVQLAGIIAAVLMLINLIFITVYIGSEFHRNTLPLIQEKIESSIQQNQNEQDLTVAVNKLVGSGSLDYIAVYKNGSQTPSASSGSRSGGLSSMLFSELSGSLDISSTDYHADYTVNSSYVSSLFIHFGLLAAVTVIAATIIMMFISVYLQNICYSRMKHAIKEKDFDGFPVPSVGAELQNFVSETDAKLEELKNKNKDLESRVNQDPLTNLFNRTYFRSDLERMLADKDNSDSSLLAIVRATELSIINETRGYPIGDKYLRDVAGLVAETAKKFRNAVAYRLAGSDFAVLIPHAKPDICEVLGKELEESFNAYQEENEIDGVAYTGITLFNPGQTGDRILGRTDLALSKAQTAGSNSFFVQTKDSEDYLRGESEWSKVVQKIIDNRSISFNQQPIRSLNISSKCYTEIFSSFIGENGKKLPTETILAMAQRNDQLVSLEEMIIELIIEKYQEIEKNSNSWGINLSSSALTSTKFVLWLETQLMKVPEVASNLVFEISEDLLECNLVASIRLFDMLRRVGSRTSISRFGKGLSSFRLYRELKPDFIKLDPSLVDDLDRDHTSQQFIRMIVEISHRLGCTVIAEGVEEFNQKRTLESMYIDAVQGYLIAKPAPIEEINSHAQAAGPEAPSPEKPKRKRTAEEILAELPRGNI